MAALLRKRAAWITIFVLFSLSATVSGDRCIDRTYKHEERDCCLCGIGKYVAEHCTKNLQPGKCEPCPPDTYSSQPNGQKSCEPCTSCSHPNGNQEVAERCTPASDTKCRCKKGHYCGSDICKLCQPCSTCGPEFIEIPCTDRNDTVCKEKNKGGDTGMIVGIVVPLVLVLVGVVVWLLWKRKRSAQAQLPKENPSQVVIPLRKNVDPEPHLPDIAEVIGWDDMKDLAIRCHIERTKIDDCQRNHPGQAHEQTLELLQIWVEREGIEAGNSLIQILEKTNRKRKAEKDPERRCLSVHR